MSDFAKPAGAQLGWQLLGTTHPYQSRYFKLRQDRLRIKGGEETTYTYVDKGDAVIVVPVTSDGRMVLIRQYRYPVDDWCLEVPAGGSHDANGASLEEIVRRELQEEIGGSCRELQYVTGFYSADSMLNETCHIYLALGVEFNSERRLQETEDIELQIEPVENALQLARSGAIKTGQCALAILLCENLLRERGLLQQ
jgi:ADP-ribose pyrophosphatase